MTKHFGKCALCGRKTELTFEHIPPKAAFNSMPAKPVTGESLLEEDRVPWDIAGLRYVNQQSGMGQFSLCQECNNNTGAWYGGEYQKIACNSHFALKEAGEALNKWIKLLDVRPLPFIKQILSMFCSINNFEDGRFDDLRKFVLDKNAISLDRTRYKLCMYFTRSNLMKSAPLSVLLRVNEKTLAISKAMALTEITAYPLGFILYFDPTDDYPYNGVDITSFSDYKFEDKCDIEMPLCIYEMNDVFPTYYRTKEEIIDCRENNIK